MKNKAIKHSGNKDFFKGFASAFDVSGLTFIDVLDISDGPARDAAAIRGDWQQVGRDFKASMDTVACEQ